MEPTWCTKEEWEQRVNLAAAFQLCHFFGLSDLIWTHLSARVPGEEGRFLLNPDGYMFDEITASNLVKVDIDGNSVNGGKVNPAAFTIHSAVYQANNSFDCAVHLHANAGCTVAALQEELPPVNQFAYDIGEISYHDYEGFALNWEERERLISDLGENQVMILKNHGTLAVGITIQDAFKRAYYLEKLCKIYIGACATGKELVIPTKEVSDRAREQVTRFGVSGEAEWPALLRLLQKNNITEHLR